MSIMSILATHKMSNTLLHSFTLLPHHLPFSFRVRLGSCRICLSRSAIADLRISSPSHKLSSTFSLNDSPFAIAKETAHEGLNIPFKLLEIVKLFEAVPEPRAKYQQLIHYAEKLNPLSEEFKTKENKVEGCVSQVWVRAWLDGERRLFLEADSDSVLTKGLAALLVEGLSGSNAVDVLRLGPDFIQMLGLKQSLTPSRSNGFFNMFKLIQKKTLQLYVESQTGSVSSRECGGKAQNFQGEAESGGNSALSTPKTEMGSAVDVPDLSKLSLSRRDRILRKMEEELEPMVLEVEDVSHQHAGHAGVRGSSGETHFNLKVASDKFEGRTLVKRHRLVYDLLQDELQTGLHALSIIARTPAEMERDRQGAV